MNTAVSAPVRQFIPFTRIKGKSDRKRIPIVGKIRLGVKVNGQKGVYPVETPYFVVPPEIEQVTGEKPTELDVLLLSEDEERIYPQALKRYTASGLMCIGNNEQAMEYNDTTHRFESCPCPCPALDSGDCKKRANLLLFIPSVSSGGLYQIDSSNFDSMQNINGYFEFLRLTFGRISNIPLKLRRVPMNKRYNGQPTTHYPLELRYEGDAELTAQLKRETPEVLRRMQTFEIQEAIETNPLNDTEAPIVAEEDLATVLTITPSQPNHQQEPTMTQPTTPPLTPPMTAVPPTPTAPAAQKNDMTDKQRYRIDQMAASRGISTERVTELTQGYNKRQASGLIDQLIAGDYSAFDLEPEGDASGEPEPTPAQAAPAQVITSEPTTEIGF